MNKKLKHTLILINSIMLAVAIYWTYKDFQPEPFIVAIGQFATLLTLIFEGKVTNFITENISSNSEINIDVHRGTSATTKEVKDSKVTIKTK